MKRLKFLIYTFFARNSLRNFAAVGLFYLGALPIKAQYTVLHNFGSVPSDGVSPYGSLTLSKGALYGMTSKGGQNNYGEIFSLDTNGSSYRDLHDFDSIHGSYPQGSSLTPLGKFLYGTTTQGGLNNDGCIFIIDTNGSGFKDLFDFNGATGQCPVGTLTISGSLLYGMTLSGSGMGVLFSIDTNGNGFKDLIYFNGSNGADPRGSLTLLENKLYGMTSEYDLYGNIFSLDTNGSGFQDLYDFSPSSTDGANPDGTLSLSGGVLYGVSSKGGWHELGNIFSIDTNGNGYNDLHDFSGGDGSFPNGSLTLSGRVLYGMTAHNGANGGGTIFSIDTDGSGFKNLFDFSSPTGTAPYGNLTLSGKMVYGMTEGGGTDGNGVIFSLNYVTAGINTVTPSKSAINVYPNPNNGIFALALSNVNEACNVEVYNILGEKVYTETLPQYQTKNTINMNGQPNGVYLYRVITQDGCLVGEGKVDIEK